MLKRYAPTDLNPPVRWKDRSHVDRALTNFNNERQGKGPVTWRELPYLSARVGLASFRDYVATPSTLAGTAWKWAGAAGAVMATKIFPPTVPLLILLNGAIGIWRGGVPPAVMAGTQAAYVPIDHPLAA